MQFRDAQMSFCDGFKTLVMQESIKHGMLFRGAFVFSLAHGQKETDKTLSIFKRILKVYRAAIKKGSYTPFLVGEPVKPVFRKWN